MKNLFCITAFMLVIISVVALIPYTKADPGCMVHFDTSRGPESFYLAAKNIDGISRGYREDRTQQPNWCVWFVCSYPRVESSWIITRDMTSYHVRDTLEVAEAKVQNCKPNFQARH